MDIATRRAMSSAMVEVAPAIHVPEAFTASVSGDELPVDLTLAVALNGGRFVVRELTVRQRPGGREVTAELLREVPVARVVRACASTAAMTTRGPRPVTVEVGQGPDDEALEQVALQYRWAVLFGEPPIGRLVAVLGLTRATAKRWVTLARERGFLPPAQED